MDAIKYHINFLFRDAPITDENVRIKKELYLQALDRYEELITLGKTESEALGTVIVEMGDQNKLLENLGYGSFGESNQHVFHTLNEARGLITSYNHQASKIGLGIFLILLGAGLVPTLRSFNWIEVGVILLFLFVAAGVGLFIHAGLTIENIEESHSDKDRGFYLSEKDYTVVKEEFFLFKEKERFRIVVGVILSIVSVIPILLFAFLKNEFLIERYGVLLLMTIVGMGVYQFVKYGMRETAYEKVLNLGEYSEEDKQFQQKLKPLSSIYWMIVTLIYLAWSFISSTWNYTWIIWPLASILWGIITLIYRQSTHKDFL